MQLGSRLRALLLAAAGLTVILLLTWQRKLPEDTPFQRVVVPAVTAPLAQPDEVPQVGRRDYSREPIVITLPRRAAYDVFDCDVPCHVSNQWADNTDAHADMRRGIRIFMSATDPKQSLEELQQHYHIVATPTLTSDVPTPHFSWDNYNLFSKPIESKNSKVPVVMVMSTCNSPNGRADFAQELMRHIDIDSYGACLHNKESPWPDDYKSTERHEHKRALLREYKFAASFEPTSRDDHVSERFFTALEAGAVPIHYGCKDVHRFAPAPNSVISASDFKSAKALADHVKDLMKNPDKYNKMMAWKTNGTTSAFNNIAGINSVEAECRLCIRVADVLRRGGMSSTADMRSANPGSRVMLLVRSRGFYEFYSLAFDTARTIERLRTSISELFAGKPSSKLPLSCEPKTGREPLYEIRRLGRDWLLRDHATVATDRDVEQLRDGDELEVTWDWRPPVQN